MIDLPATSIKQQATESKGEPKLILPSQSRKYYINRVTVDLVNTVGQLNHIKPSY